jgi:hypothetical protein
MSSESGYLRSKRSQSASQHSVTCDWSPVGSDQRYHGSVPPEQQRKGSGSVPLIERNNSMGSDLNYYFDAGDVIQAERPLAQSYGRVANIKDWIDRHSFPEADVKDAMKKVDWGQFLPHEKLIAFNFAKERASSTLREFMSERRASGLSVNVKPNTLRNSVYTESDKKAIKSSDLNKLPNITEPGVADDPKLLRTTVVLAMVYHEIWTRNDASVQTAAERSFFQMWLRQPGEIDDLKPVVERADELRKLNLSRETLKIVTHELTAFIRGGLSAYQAHSDGKSPESVENMIMETYAGDLPGGCMDIWRVDHDSINKWDL